MGACLAAGCQTARTPNTQGKPMTQTARLEVQGHRGCRGLRPENSMAGFRHAVALGVDVIELDLALTRDKVLVVVHDPQINEQLCSEYEALPERHFSRLTWDQVQGVECGSKKNHKYPEQLPVKGERIPRLGQVLDLLDQHPKLGANIEIKTFADRPEATLAPAAFAEALVGLLKRRGLTGRVVVQSFDARALLEVRQRDSSITLAALAEDRAEFEPMLQKTGATILSPRFSELTPELLADYRRRQIRVIPWTVNEPQDMRRLIGWGVQGIITDRPDLLLKIIKR